MAFPKRLLTKDESIILDLRPHWIALVGPVVVTVLVLAAWGFILTNLPRNKFLHPVLFWGSLAIGLFILIWYCLRTLIKWATAHFVVTNERVIHRQGLISKTSMEIPLDRIQNVRFHQGIFERMIGAGDIVIESAGERGDNSFSEIRRPETVQKVIYERAESHTMKMQGGGPAPAPAAPSATEELQRLADLRDRGAITEAEYQAQKSRLLGEG
jgi:uncharacterized membrane protein YdbT with pleckstrin-like domain